MESQVGDTMFIRARNIERELGFGQLWLKFEGDNPSGTQKDRIAWAHVGDALRRGFDTVTVATCGNFGVALAGACAAAGLACVVFIPEAYHTRRTGQMLTEGVGPSRVSTLSYGEELPMERDSTEAAWTQNRRAEFRVTWDDSGAVAGTVQ